MTAVALLRHAATEWTQAGRIQGRADPPLSAAGQRDAGGWRLPADIVGWRCLTSPLVRARSTAALIAPAPIVEPRLIEMAWGAWEGRRLRDIRADPAADLASREAMGLDFQAPGGESYREVQSRLAPLLARIAAAGEPAVLVSHKGVAHALLALATGWRMLDPPPLALADGCIHLFDLSDDGTPTPGRINIPLGGAGEAESKDQAAENLVVIPAKAGTHSDTDPGEMGSSLRWNDNLE